MIYLKHRTYTLIPRHHVYLVRDGRAARCAFVFLERDRFFWEFLNCEGPKQTGDRKEQNAFGNTDAGTDSSTVAK